MFAKIFHGLLPSQKPRLAATTIAAFLESPEHHWILHDLSLRTRFIDFLTQLPESALHTALDERGLLLFFCRPHLSCSFHQYPGRHIVFVFPELKRLLLSAEYRQAYAILAHELGHVLANHTNRAIDPTQAQLEADRYAADWGFGEELFRVLREETPTEELVQRLEALLPWQRRALRRSS